MRILNIETLFSVTMCPLCANCSTWPLHQICDYTRIACKLLSSQLFVLTLSYENIWISEKSSVSLTFSSLDLFDHPGTVFYAVFMSFWGELSCSCSSLFSPIGDSCHLLQQFSGSSYLDISKKGIIHKKILWKDIFPSSLEHFTKCSFEKFWMLISFVVKLRLSFELSLALAKI